MDTKIPPSLAFSITRHSLLGKERGPVTLRPTTQVVDRTLPEAEEEEAKEVFEVTPRVMKRLRQQSMYQFVCQQSRQETIDEDTTRKEESYCSKNQQNTVVHGHYHRSGIEIKEEGMFRVYYNNVNGFSTGSDNNDIQMFVKYLGRPFTSSDDDWAAVSLNLRNARGRCAQVSRVLSRQGATPKVSRMFYKAVCMSVLLFGSETWVVTDTIQRALDAFHHRAARFITGRHIRHRADGTWDCPSTDVTLEQAGLHRL